MIQFPLILLHGPRRLTRRSEYPINSVCMCVCVCVCVCDQEQINTKRITIHTHFISISDDLLVQKVCINPRCYYPLILTILVAIDLLLLRLPEWRLNLDSVFQNTGQWTKPHHEVNEN